MLHDVEIIGTPITNDYESVLTIKLHDLDLDCFCLVPFEYAQKNLRVGTKTKVDLWVLNGKAKAVQAPIERNCVVSEIERGVISGFVEEIYNSREFRLDSALFEIDIMNEVLLDLSAGQYIETHGTYQMFLPDTEYSKENCW